MRVHILVAIIAFSVASPALASGDFTGRVTALHTYTGHDGILIQLDAMANPDGCPGAGWLIFPDTDKHATFVQSLLITAKVGKTPVRLWVDGCFQNYPRVVHVASS